jgi:hypothetical protein
LDYSITAGTKLQEAGGATAVEVANIAIITLFSRIYITISTTWSTSDDLGFYAA